MGVAPAGIATARRPVGSLSQLKDKRGCLSADKRRSCAKIRGDFFFPADIKVAPDGGDLYVTTLAPFDAEVARFGRRPKDGTLRQVAGLHECDTASCPVGRRFDDPRRLVFSGDGQSAYLVQNQPMAESGFSGINVYSRHLGMLVPPVGAAPCLSSVPISGCTSIPAMVQPWDLVLSPDGSNAYVVASLTKGKAAPAVLRVLARDPTSGGLAPLPGSAGCLSAGGVGGCTSMPTSFTVDRIAVAPDGRSVYASGSHGVDPVTDGTIWAFARDAQTGALSPLPGQEACVSDRFAGCQHGRGLKGSRVLVSPDGLSVYAAASDDDALTEFRRDAVTGALTQAAGRGGCLQMSGRFGCRRDAALFNAGFSFGEGFLMSKDGRTVYVTTQSAPFESGSAVTVFARNASTGVLSRLRGRAWMRYPVRPTLRQGARTRWHSVPGAVPR
jgi:DNA-binding beta-propeller fold protein YncE